MSRASPSERHVFGVDATIHPITKMALETGSGALPPDQQARIHCDVIEHQHGKHAGDKMRALLKATADEAAAAAELAEAETSDDEQA